MTYLEEHNKNEHNYHTDWQDIGFDICIECDLIRRTGGTMNWLESELVTDKEYVQAVKGEDNSPLCGDHIQPIRECGCLR